jgi:hypothetical protein
MAARAVLSGLVLGALASAYEGYPSMSSAMKPSKCARTTTVTEWVTVADPRDQQWATPIPVTTAYSVKPLPYGMDIVPE